jgi:hypothetical protein
VLSATPLLSNPFPTEAVTGQASAQTNVAAGTSSVFAELLNSISPGATSGLEDEPTLDAAEEEPTETAATPVFPFTWTTFSVTAFAPAPSGVASQLSDGGLTSAPQTFVRSTGEPSTTPELPLATVAELPDSLINQAEPLTAAELSTPEPLLTGNLKTSEPTTERPESNSFLQTFEESVDKGSTQAEAAASALVGAPESWPPQSPKAIEWSSAAQPAPELAPPVSGNLSAPSNVPPPIATGNPAEAPAHPAPPEGKSEAQLRQDLPQGGSPAPSDRNTPTPLSGGEVAFTARLQALTESPASVTAPETPSSTHATPGSPAIQPVEPQQQNAQEWQQSEPQPDAQAFGHAPQNVSHESSAGQAPVMTAAPSVPSSPQPAPPPREVPSTAPVPEPPASPETRSTGTVEEIRLQLGDSPSNRVEVLLTQKEGALHVSTRTQSPELAQSLRENLPDLVTNLGQRGLQADVWAGGKTVSVGQPEELSTRTSNGPNHDPDGNDTNGREHQQTDYGQPGHRERRPRMPVWEDLDD